MENKTTFISLLEKLGIQKNDLIYLHTSFKRMSYLQLSPEEFINTLIEYLGTDGTLVMPSFAWNLDKTQRPWKGYKDYFEQRPVFDVKNTKANIGIIPETFRKMDGVKRSSDYWWSVCAYGPMAEEVTANQEKIGNPYAPGSSFDMLRLNGVKILGLGVTLNTTSLALIPDYVLGDEHTQQIFTKEPQKGTVIDKAGNKIETNSIWLLPEAVKLIKPSVLIENSQKIQNVLNRIDEDDVIQFAYPYEVYHKEAVRLGKKAICAGKPVPWFLNYPLKNKLIEHI